MNDKMNSKEYAKYDKTYMMFGSVMNGLQEFLGKQSTRKAIDEIITSAWDFCKKETGKFVEDCYKNPEENESLPL